MATETSSGYVTIGPEFFARLVSGIAQLSHEPWTWNRGFAQRWQKHHQYNAMRTMKALAQQNLTVPVELPEPMSTDQAMRILVGVGEPTTHSRRDGYDALHRVLEF